MIIAIGLVVLGLVLLGLFFTYINDGATYVDTKYYRVGSSDKIIIRQYYDHGAFGSSSRYIVRYPLIGKIGWIREVNKKRFDAKWIEIKEVEE